ncbi:unnamed protein product [Caenorhabditis angaria]|uniref:Uncharacterized protein n=1 Tax=Caenorhabditis angaria TaxID=860376 RepID=A0A9P1MZ68_9PELO|nr:unnamed protein product [Caenorhabditis angaria]
MKFLTTPKPPAPRRSSKNSWKAQLGKIETKQLIPLIYTTFRFINLSSSEIYEIDSFFIDFHRYLYIITFEVIFLLSAILAAFGTSHQKPLLLTPILLIEILTFISNLILLPKTGNFPFVFILAYVIYCNVAVFRQFWRMRKSLDRDLQFSLDSDDESEAENRTLWTTISMIFHRTPESLPKKLVFFEMPTTFANSNVHKPYA